jgi:hypothetical protein
MSADLASSKPLLISPTFEIQLLQSEFPFVGPKEKRSIWMCPHFAIPFRVKQSNDVVSFLPRLQALRPDEIVVKSPVEIDDQGRLIIVSLHGEYHPLVEELLQALYENGFVRNFNWPKWQRQAVGISSTRNAWTRPR